jgi:hypothetical protein
MGCNEASFRVRSSCAFRLSAAVRQVTDFKWPHGSMSISMFTREKFTPYEIRHRSTSRPEGTFRH